MPQRQKTFFDGPTSREIHKPITTGNVASDAAAERVRIRTGSQAWRITSAVTEAGDYGLTDPEIEAKTGIAGNSERPRRLRLQELGYIRLLLDSDLKPVLRDGCSVYIATSKKWPE